MAKIQPVINSAQEVYDYLNISAASAAANLDNGTTTRAAWITHLMGIAAQQIVRWCDYDWTTNQVMLFTFVGNNSPLAEALSPIATVSALQFIDSTNQTAGVQSLSTGIVTVQANQPTWFLRNDGANWDSWSEYFMTYTQAVDPLMWNDWPEEAKAVQLEMIGTFYRESNNADGIMGINTQFGNSNVGFLGVSHMNKYLKGTVSLKDLTDRWKERLRPIRKMSI